VIVYGDFNKVRSHSVPRKTFGYSSTSCTRNSLHTINSSSSCCSVATNSNVHRSIGG